MLIITRKSRQDEPYAGPVWDEGSRAETGIRRPKDNATTNCLSHLPMRHGAQRDRAATAVDGVHLAHAATAGQGDQLIATGGRVLNVVGLGTTFAEARDRVYRAVAEIGLEGGQHRTDIAARVVED